MKIKNLKINKRIKALIAAGIVTFQLAGCSINGNESVEPTRETYVTDENTLKDGIKQVVINNKIVSVEDIKLAYAKDNKIVDKIDGVIVDKQIQDVKNPIDIKFGKNIDGVIVGDSILKTSDFKLINAKTNEEIKKIDFIVSNDELVSAGKVSSSNSSKNDSNEEEVQDVELTREDFDNAVLKFETALTNRGINFNHQNVVKTAILLNIKTLTNEDNIDLYDELMKSVNNPGINDMILTYFDLEASFNNPNYNQNKQSNYYQFYTNNVPYENLMTFEQLVLSNVQKKEFAAVADRFNKMSYMLDTNELNSEIVKLYSEFKDKHDGKFDDLTEDTILALTTKFGDARGMLFMVCNQDDRVLTDEAKTAISYFAPYNDDEMYCSITNSVTYNEINEAYNNATENVKKLTK